jgi:outer membrane protein assembly factor BamD (BamD/ComL family)
VSDEQKRSEDAARRAQGLAAEMVTRFGDSDYTRRAQSIAYRIQQGIAIYGTDRD